MYSTNSSGLVPRRTKSQKRKTICVLHDSEPDWRWKLCGGNFCDLTKPRIVPYKNTWKPHQNTVYWCDLKLAQEKGLLFYPDKVACNCPPRHTTSCLHRESGMHEDEGWSKPKGTLNSKSTAGCIKIELSNWSTRSTRTGRKKPSGSKLPWETGRNTVDNRISGVPLSAVEQKDIHCNDKVKQLIEKFENHTNKESFLQDLKQTKEINKFSEKSQELIADMNNTEIFELCETTSKQQCPGCNCYWEAGIVYCSCGRCLRMSRNEKEGATTMSCRYPAMLSRRITSAEREMDLPSDKDHTTSPWKCCIKRLLVQVFVDTHWMDLAGRHAIWQNRLGKSFMRREKS